MRLRVGIISVAVVLTAGVVCAAPKPPVKNAPKQVKHPRIDLVFCVDTTGSMGDEIGVVKDRMKDMIAKIADGKPTPKVRVGIVAYRDRGDAYVVQKTLITDDLDAAVKTVTELNANGGGDKEESVNEALHVAVSEMNWDRTKGITRLVYLIGDAGPHKYQQDYDPDKERAKALRDGIIINAIGCSGIEDNEAAFFEKMAKGTEGAFSYLTYREEYAKADGSKVVVLKEGDRSYAYAPSALATTSGGPAPADWRGGSAMAKSTGAARELKADELSTASRPSSPSTRDKDGWQINATMMNNLDVVMTRQAQTLAARQQGVVYDNADLIPFLRELQGPRTGIAKQSLLVINNEKQWRELWAKHQSYQSKPEALPKVDFTKEMVVVAAVPESSNSNIVLREVNEVKGKVIVNYATSAAPKGTASPFHFAVIKKTASPLVWEKGK